MRPGTSTAGLLSSLVAVLLCLALAACSAGKTEPLPSGELTADHVSQVVDILRSAGLSNADQFREWVLRSTAARSEADASASGFTDADCRMTVMLLAGDLIESDSVEESYSGDYLMFDLNAIENGDDFAVLRPKKELFTTLFGEMPIPASGFADALPERWREHGVRLADDRCSIISIVFQTYDGTEAFVGHTGLLIDCRDISGSGCDYLFVEKIAFGDPFLVTTLSSREELLEVLSQRADYAVAEGEHAPAVYQNSEFIGELSQS